jgi:hypothetical protein
MRRTLAVLALALAGCSQLQPYEFVPRPPLRGAGAEIPRVGICYNALFADAAAVRTVAEEACAGIGAPQLVEQDMRLACPLLTPVRATFACLPER